MNMDINADNYKLVKAYVELIGLPMRNEICEYLEEKYGNAEPDISEILKGEPDEGKN